MLHSKPVGPSAGSAVEVAMSSSEGLAEQPELGRHMSLPLAGCVYWIDEDRWEWADEMYALHGLARGELVPTTELLLAHKHPDDRESVHAVFTEAIAHGTPFACRHRIIDAHQNTHAVIAFGYVDVDHTGTPVAVRGYIAEVTEPLVAETRAAADFAVVQATSSRSTIDQAKGIVMSSYGLGADEAFAVLEAVSKHTNTKVRDLAAVLVDHASRDPAHRGGCPAATADLIRLLEENFRR